MTDDVLRVKSHNTETLVTRELSLAEIQPETQQYTDPDLIAVKTFDRNEEF